MNRAFLGVAVGATLLLATAGSCLAEDADAGIRAYNSRKYRDAYRILIIQASKGNAAAQFCLGSMYHDGNGVPKNEKEAIKWFRLSAEQGYSLSEYMIGWYYYHGVGVPQDYRESEKWWRLSAEEGVAIAQANLGILYAMGQGITQNKIIAHMWLNIAASNGVGWATETRNTVAGHMSKQEIDLAQQMASRCVDRQYKRCDY